MHKVKTERQVFILAGDHGLLGDQQQVEGCRHPEKHLNLMTPQTISPARQGMRIFLMHLKGLVSQSEPMLGHRPNFNPVQKAGSPQRTLSTVEFNQKSLRDKLPGKAPILRN